MEQKENTKVIKKENRIKRQRPQRKRRINIDRNVEVVVMNNTFGRFIYENPRMTMVIDMENYGDEEYVTVGDLRVILNSNRKILENFMLLITEVLDDNLTLEDVLLFLGLDKKYKEFFALNHRKNSSANVRDIQYFIIKSNPEKFERMMENMDERLRNRVIDTSVKLFKLKKLTDYRKMQVIRKFVNDDLFLDAEETDIDLDLDI